MKLRQDFKEALCGFVFLSVCIGAFYAVAATQHNAAAKADAGKFMMSASFGRTNGLHEGDEVHLSGIKVGTVVKETLEPDYRVHVTMQLDKDYQIPVDSSLAIESDSIMGGKFIDITLGGDDEVVENGGSLIYTQDAMVLEELLDLVISYANSKKNKKKDETK